MVSDFIESDLVVSDFIASDFVVSAPLFVSVVGLADGAALEPDGADASSDLDDFDVSSDLVAGFAGAWRVLSSSFCDCAHTGPVAIMPATVSARRLFHVFMQPSS